MNTTSSIYNILKSTTVYSGWGVESSSEKRSDFPFEKTSLTFQSTNFTEMVINVST